MNKQKEKQNLEKIRRKITICRLQAKTTRGIAYEMTWIFHGRGNLTGGSEYINSRTK